MERLKYILVAQCLLALMPAAVFVLLGDWIAPFALLGIVSIAYGLSMSLAVLVALPDGDWLYKFAFGMALLAVLAIFNAALEAMRLSAAEASGLVVEADAMPFAAALWRGFSIWMAVYSFLCLVMKFSVRLLGRICYVRHPERKELLQKRRQFSLFDIMAVLTIIALVLGLFRALMSVDQSTRPSEFEFLLIAALGFMLAWQMLLGVWTMLRSADAELRVVVVFVSAAVLSFVLAFLGENDRAELSRIRWSPFHVLLSTATLLALLMPLRAMQYRLAPRNWQGE